MPSDPSLLITPERNRFFYGMLMDAERFQKDQDYFNQKRWLLNRFVTAGGVLCGLGLTFNNGGLSRAPAIAIDLSGREIIVPTATPIDIGHLTDAQGQPTGPMPAAPSIIVSPAYAEQKTDPLAVLVLDCDHLDHCAPATVSEGFAVLLRLATGPATALARCMFGTFPLSTGLTLQSDIAERIAGGFAAGPVDPCVPLGRPTLHFGPLDAVSDRPVIYDNNRLFQLIVCLAGEVSALSSDTLTYVSGDNQLAKSGAALPAPLVVAVRDGSGNPVVAANGADIRGDRRRWIARRRDRHRPGQYQATWTLGSSGAQTVTAQTVQSALTVTFHATIKP